MATTEYLIKQAYINASFNIAWVVILISSILMVYLFLNSIVIDAVKKDEKKDVLKLPVVRMLSSVLILLVVITVILAPFLLKEAYTGFFNTGYKVSEMIQKEDEH